MKKVLLVGGGASIIDGIRHNYASIGIEIHDWWQADRGNAAGAAIPLACDAVVALVDACDHPTFNGAKAAAQRQGVMFVGTSRRWVIARDKLIELGLGQENFQPSLPHPERAELPPRAEVNVLGEEIEEEETPPRWSADGKPRDELLRVLKEVIAELITAHNIGNIKITDEGKITMDVLQKLDIDLILRHKD